MSTLPSFSMACAVVDEKYPSLKLNDMMKVSSMLNEFTVKL